MSDQNVRKEIKRTLMLLKRMAELANHVEQTGSFESAAKNSVRRYNAIIEHLEDEDIVPDELFPRLDEDEDFGSLGAECTLLMGYLEDMLEEEGEQSSPKKKQGGFGINIGELAAVAPFLGSNELSKLIRERFKEAGSEEEGMRSSLPDLKTIAALAPHMNSREVGQMVKACLTRQKDFDPKHLVALAPHMDSEEFGQIIRDYLPEWLDATRPVPPKPPQTPEPPQPPAPPRADAKGWGSWSAPGREPEEARPYTEE